MLGWLGQSKLLSFAAIWQLELIHAVDICIVDLALVIGVAESRRFKAETALCTCQDLWQCR